MSSSAQCARVLVLLVACCLASAAQAGESRFQRTVDALAAGDPAERARFADIALLQLAEIYLAEADLARGEAREVEQPGELLAWADAVERLARGLLSLAAAVESGSPVALRRYPQEVPGIDVEGRVVLLAHPRADQQPAFEQAVLERFCTGDACTGLTATSAQPAPAAPLPVEPRWEFSANGAQCSYRGLQVHFDRAGDLAHRRDQCREFLQEAETLAVEIARQAQYGVAVDWKALQITRLAGKPGHLVRLNGAGDSLLAQLPLLAARPGLPGALAPWLQGRFSVAGPPNLTLEAAELGWE